MKNPRVLQSVGGLGASACLLCLLIAPHAAWAQAINISSFGLDVNGVRQFAFTGDATNYYVLYHGTTVTDITTPVQVVFGAPSTTSMQDTQAQTSVEFYRVRTIATNAPTDLDADGVNDVAELLAGTDPLVANTPIGALVINEVDYDQPGTDFGEFVEILNVSTNPVSLAGLQLVLVNGANNTTYLTVDLSNAGSHLAPGQYLVIKASTISVPPGTQFINFGPASNNIQNGAPDGVALFDSNSNQLLDSLSYEGAITAAMIGTAPGTYNLVEGTVLDGAVADSGTMNGSLVRMPNGQDTNDANNDWWFSTTPTPGTANLPF